MTPQIAMRQSVNGNKDPVLVVTLTDHPSYLKDSFIAGNVDHAVTLFRKWLESKYNAVDGNTDQHPKKKTSP